MKRNGMLNSEIVKVLADLGHTDTIVIADCGLPVPVGVHKIDLALKLGVPGFFDVLGVLEEEMVIEKITFAEEAYQENESLARMLEERFQQATVISHEQLKEATRQAKVVIRTGEATPYANVILHAGVIF